jgi:carbohydrate-selective porin OprB
MGGHGFLLGDGQLHYGHERILEGYYRVQLGRFVQVSPDVQQIWNPGYNRDRGPATVFALRLNARY